VSADSKDLKALLSPDDIRRRRQRSLAIALALAALAVLFYALTIAKLGPLVLSRPL
jgi:ferric-dicitrate binding protein FerR (iron transport regulator)